MLRLRVSLSPSARVWRTSLTPSVGFADSSPLGEQLGTYPAVQTSMIRPKPRMSPVVVGAMRFMA